MPYIHKKEKQSRQLAIKFLVQVEKIHTM